MFKINLVTLSPYYFVQVRADEIPELEQQMQDSCETVIKGGAENSYGKVNILLQAYVSKAQLDSFSLISDMSYVAQVSFVCCYKITRMTKVEDMIGLKILQVKYSLWYTLGSKIFGFFFCPEMFPSKIGV